MQGLKSTFLSPETLPRFPGGNGAASYLNHEGKSSLRNSASEKDGKTDGADRQSDGNRGHRSMALL